VFRQGAHQIDVVRAIVGKKITSVRAVAGKWHPRFDTEGNYTAFLEFEDGTPATLVFNGYGGFDIGELTWGISESGYASAKETEETEAGGPVSAADKYTGPTRAEKRKRRGERKQPFFGLTLVSCEKGDIRQSPDGLYIYTDGAREEIFCPPFLDRAGDLLRLYDAVTENRDILADGTWGKATLEVVIAILQSSSERREIALTHPICPTA
jgi:phthalate 4,5-cis-dihydrodiol dehydrogenase